MENFYGDPARDSPWSAFIAKFERQASRSEWSDKRKQDRLYDCLSGTALEFANKCIGKDQFEALKRNWVNGPFSHILYIVVVPSGSQHAVT